MKKYTAMNIGQYKAKVAAAEKNLVKIVTVEEEYVEEMKDDG